MKELMRKIFLAVFLTIAVVTVHAQKKQITLEEIWSGAFRTQGLDALQSMKSGKQYTVLNFNRSTRASTVDAYNYETLKKVKTIVSSTDLDKVNYFTSYEFSKNESKLLLATEVEGIFRHSTLGIFYVYDIASKNNIKVSQYKIREPSFSPDGTKVAYVLQNNIYIFDVTTKTTKQITTDGVPNKIINGVTDWVYEEEFAFVRAFEWNSDGSKIAFLRFDESEVPEFSMDVYGTDLYPFQYQFKYPKAGEKNAVVSLHMLDVASGEIDAIDLNDAYYIPRIKWTNNPNYLSVQTLNRHQNHLKMYTVNAKKNSVSILLEERDKAYIDIKDDLTFLADDSFIWTSEKDGYNHIYLYNEDGELMSQVTKGAWEVTAYYGYDANEDAVYYQSTENGSINRGVYSVSSSGDDKKKLAIAEGQNSADFSSDFTYFINTHSSATTPPVYSLYESIKGKKVKDIQDNSRLLNKLKSYEVSPKEFSTISVNGNDLNMWMIKPANFDSSKKYPLFMFQ